MYNMVVIANNPVLYTWELLREYILNVLTIKKQRQLCDGVEFLAVAIVVMKNQYINVSNQHTVHLKLRECYTSIISHWSW